MNARNSISSIIILLSLAVLSCDDLRESVIEVKPGEELQVRLREGSDVLLAPDYITIKFTSMLQESRCPQQATCIWGGIAIVQANVKQAEQQNTALILWIPGLVTTPYRRNRVEISGYYITLLQLDPYPALDDSQQPKVYEALLGIEKIRTR